MSFTRIIKNFSSLISVLLLLAPPSFAQFPYAVGTASSNGTNPTGTLNLGNTAQASYSPANGFHATSNTQNVATGPNASIVSSAAANVVLGDAGSDPSQWNIVGTGNAYTNGNVGTGNVQDLNQASGTYGNQVTGQSQSQIQGSGTDIDLSSTSNAQVAAQPLPPGPPAVRALNKAGQHRDIPIAAYPNSQSASSSAGTAPQTGSVNLTNNAQSTYNSNNGFAASSMTQNSAAGPSATLQSSAAASSQTGYQAVGPYNVIGTGNAFSMGNALTGSIQNQNQAQGSSGSNVLGQGVSGISGNGTNLALSSTANSQAQAYPASSGTNVRSVKKSADAVAAQNAVPVARSAASKGMSTALKSKVVAMPSLPVKAQSHVALNPYVFHPLLRREQQRKSVRASSGQSVRTAVRHAQEAVRKTQVVAQQTALRRQSVRVVKHA